MSYLHAAGHRLEYEWLHPRARTRARADAPVLVFLHEGLGSTALWKDFPQLVAEATGCPALVYSRYGYGKSDRLAEPRTVDYIHEEALETLPRVLEALAIRDPFLIGHSDGASISLIHAVLAHCAHSPHVDQTQTTLATIAEFVESVKR